MVSSGDQTERRFMLALMGAVYEPSYHLDHKAANASGQPYHLFGAISQSQSMNCCRIPLFGLEPFGINLYDPMAPLTETISTTHLIVGGAAAVVGAFSLYLSTNTPSAKAKRLGAALPPGPKPAFFVGNLFNFPKSRWYETFSRWAEEYGDVVYVNVIGIPMVVLNSLDPVTELMDKRMNIYSNRPSTTMSKLSGLSFATTRLQPGPEFNEQRRVFRKAMNPQAVADYDSFIQRDRDNLVRQLDGFSGNPFLQFVNATGAVLTRIAYGEQLFKDHGEELIDVNTNVVTLATWVSSKVWLVDLIPPLQYLPDWFPGAVFKRVLRQSNELASMLRYRAYDKIMERIADGTADESILTKYLDEGSFSRENLRDAIAVMYGAGVDTTSTALLNFFFCITLYREWQQKVHEEMDRVLGRGHLPTREEIHRLPIFNAVWKEAFRWNPPVPIGLPHFSVKENVWNGYYLPKGTVVHCNIGYILRDKRIWGADSQTFNPARFLPEFNPQADQFPDMWDIPFGFGRRICPGRYLAERVALQFAASVLSTYQVLPVKGKPLNDTMKFEDSVIRRVADFECQFKPRCQQP